jgi:hypothetical protein
MTMAAARVKNDPGAYAALAELVTFRPLDRPANSATEWSPFKASWTSTVKTLRRELEAIGARHAVMLVDFREQDFRADGMPRGDRRARSPGVVLTVESKRGTIRMEGVKYDDWQDNVRAIALSLEALRAVDRYGVTKSGEQYRGWLALPMGSGVSGSRGVELVREHGSVKKALHATAPDHGGDREDYESVLAARKMGMVG